MNSLQVFFSILGTILYLVGFVPYIYHVYHGRVIPHAYSWTVWAIVSGINTYALISSTGVTYSIITPSIRTFCLVIGAIVGWLVIRQIKISIIDRFAIVLAIFAIVFAYIGGISKAIIPTILIDILVLTPTLSKIWHDPDSEDAFTWFLVAFSQLSILLSLPEHTFENSLFWTYTMTTNVLIGIIISRRKIYTHRLIYRLSHIFSR